MTEAKTITCQQLWPDKPYFAVSFLGKPYGFLFANIVLWGLPAKIETEKTHEEANQIFRINGFGVEFRGQTILEYDPPPTVLVPFCEKKISEPSYLLFDSFNFRTQEPKHILPKNGSHSYQSLMIKLSEFFDYKAGVLQEDIFFEFKQVV
jgi:hypothetical protein